MALSGGCTCGAVRYTLTDAPLFNHCCHCSWCQRETGSAFVLNAMIETACVRLDKGTPEMVLTPSASGAGQEIARCPSCHVALWSHYAGLKRVMAFVRIGTLDRPGECPPDVHIFTQTKQSWVKLDGGAPVFDEYYDRETLWPESSLKRRADAIAGASPG